MGNPGAPREEDIDHVCGECGRVTMGPHKGETVPHPGKMERYKGAEVSDTLCENCQPKYGFGGGTKDKTHPYWRKRGQR